MVRRWLSGCGVTGPGRCAFPGPSASSGSWPSDSASRVHSSPMLIRFYKRRIKKLRKLAVQPDVDLWALDEVHFQQHGSRCRMWVPPEVKEPVLLHAPTRKSVGYFGALRLRDGKFIYAREEEKFNAQSCWQFLKKLRHKSLRSGKRVVI